MDSRIEQLEQEIRQLKEEITDREAALPVHSARPHQLMAIEDLEETLQQKQEELQSLLKD